MTEPCVSVCLRVYNGERYVAEAIRSVLAQTMRDFELVIVDDGSTDGTARILASFDDDRLRVLRVEHGGLSVATARSIAAARGRYLAIMDADDICERDRLARQLEIFEANEDVVVVGSDMTVVDADGATVGVRRYPRTDARIRSAMVVYNPFGHPTVMYRTSALRACGSYTTRFSTVEDYDLYFRVLRLGTGRNVAAPLVRYRIHPGSVKASKTKRQLGETIALRRIATREYGWPWNPLARVVDAIERAMLLLPSALVIAAFERAFFRRPGGASRDAARAAKR